MSDSGPDISGSDRAKIGTYEPPLVGAAPIRPDPSVYAHLASIPGLTSTISDILDDLGYRLAVPAGVIAPILPGRTVVGPVITLRYLPIRDPGLDKSSRLAHRAAFARAEPGDVLVIEGDPDGAYSVLGGLAAFEAQRAGLAGCLVDGAVRDIDQIAHYGIPVWARSRTPMTGRSRLEAVSLNMPVRFAGIQVQAGDIAVADSSGICFVPPEVLDRVCREAARLHGEESRITSRTTG